MLYKKYRRIYCAKRTHLQGALNSKKKKKRRQNYKIQDDKNCANFFLCQTLRKGIIYELFLIFRIAC